MTVVANNAPADLGGQWRHLVRCTATKARGPWLTRTIPRSPPSSCNAAPPAHRDRSQTEDMRPEERDRNNI